MSLVHPCSTPKAAHAVMSPTLSLARTHEVKGSLVVANYHIGLLDVQMFRAPHLHLDATEAFEGQDRSTQEPRAEEHT